MAPTLNTVLSGELCSGCGGCAAVAPDAVQMAVTDGGFLRPTGLAHLDAAQSRKVATICPGLGQVAPRQAHPVWGPLQNCARGYATDAQLREKSASGGALSAFVTHLLETGQVDGVIHVGADPDRPLQNATFISRNRADVLARASSRYAPSSPLEAVPQVLGDGKRYAFVGKPCDVSALAAWRKLDAQVAANFPVLVSFLCAGVPSLRGGARVSDAAGIPPDTLTQFTYRGPGWPGEAIATGADGKTGHMSYAESWGAILSKHVQHRCKICADGVGMFADVAFGDAWSADANGYPSFDDRPGQSAILARTERGRDLLAQAQAAGALVFRPLDPESLTNMQPGQVRRRRAVLARLAGLCITGRARPRYRGFALWRGALASSPLAFMRNFLGMSRRALALPRKGRRIC